MSAVKMLLLALSLAAAGTSVGAQTYFVIEDSPEKMRLVDRDSIRSSGGVSSVHQLVILPVAKVVEDGRRSYQAMETDSVLDCLKRKVRVTEIRTYDVDDRIVQVIPFEGGWGDWSNPGLEAMGKLVCDKVEPHPNPVLVSRSLAIRAYLKKIADAAK